MSGKITRIDKIKNMAVYKDFHWDTSIIDNENIVDFKKINIIYGHNYSGKTTLSRIFRALETGALSDKFNAPEFKLSFDDGTSVTQNSLTEHNKLIRVFNTDFIKDNLHFIVDDSKTIDSFAILGENNANIEEEIKKHEAQLGSEEKKTGLKGNFHAAKNEYANASKEHSDRKTKLDTLLGNKANKDIKHNKKFGDANYNKNKIQEDISTVTNDSYIQLTEEQVGQYDGLLKEEAKQVITESTPFDLKHSTITTKAKELVEKKIRLSATIPIQLEGTGFIV